MEEKNKKVDVILKRSGVLTPLKAILAQSSKNITLGLRMLDKLKEPLDKPSTSENMHFAFLFESSNSGDFGSIKDDFKLWILQKGFEDLVKGINLTLSEALIYSSIVSKGHELKTLRAFLEERNQVWKTVSKYDLPTLLLKLRPYLTSEFEYEAEIRSINHVRRCLMHRNGIVTELDLPDTNTNELKLEYLRLRLFYEMDSERVEVKAPMILPENTALQLDAIRDSLPFKLGETIQFGYEHFNAAAQTCFYFGTTLVGKLPRKIAKKG